MEIITTSPAETQKLGEEIGAALKGGEVFALSGDLGAGKTTFVQAVAKGLGITTQITSPTFILMRSYTVLNSVIEHFYHVDLYRLEENVEREVLELGIPDLWGRPDTVFFIEWAERLTALPNNVKKVTIETIDENTRKFTL